MVKSEQYTSYWNAFLFIIDYIRSYIPAYRNVDIQHPARRSVQGRGSQSRGVSVQGSLSRGSLSGGLCQGRSPGMVNSGWYSSYWNAFLFITPSFLHSCMQKCRYSTPCQKINLFVLSHNAFLWTN